MSYEVKYCWCLAIRGIKARKHTKKECRGKKRWARRYFRLKSLYYGIKYEDDGCCYGYEQYNSED